MDDFDIDKKVEQAVLDFPAGLRPWLLTVLTASAPERAWAIGELCARGHVPSLAEVLMENEEDAVGEQVRTMVVCYLRRLERTDG
jgi:hypothetical protein